LANFKLRVADEFEASSANPRRFRNLTRSNLGHHDRLILVAAAGILIGALLMSVVRFLL
jgi:hypothetical protein